MPGYLMPFPIWNRNQDPSAALGHSGLFIKELPLPVLLRTAEVRGNSPRDFGTEPDWFDLTNGD